MKPWKALRAASILSLLYAAGHSTGFPWMGPDSRENTALLEQLKGYRFDIAGASRTVWDFHVGFGLIISVDLLVQSCLLWVLASLVKRTGAVALRPLIVTIAAGFVANAVLVGRFFFLVPLSMSVAIVICLGCASWATERDSRHVDSPLVS